jgi:hypothetical protein
MIAILENLPKNLKQEHYAKNKQPWNVGHIHVSMRMSMFCAFEKNSSIIWKNSSIMQIPMFGFYFQHPVINALR